MPVSKKKPTTIASDVSTQELSPPILPEQEDFRQYLRRLAVSAIQGSRHLYKKQANKGRTTHVRQS